MLRCGRERVATCTSWTTHTHTTAKAHAGTRTHMHAHARTFARARPAVERPACSSRPLFRPHFPGRNFQIGASHGQPLPSATSVPPPSRERTNSQGPPSVCVPKTGCLDSARPKQWVAKSLLRNQLAEAQCHNMKKRTKSGCRPLRGGRPRHHHWISKCLRCSFLHLVTCWHQNLTHALRKMSSRVRCDAQA